ncbi:hypothetical protein BC937DRAFT_89869 [Endogone sp. FLAS-F59071]|nr:hypothetical protein BC937DRAFT_89869 [Endogone sp. FLAS-F59071]|eukprot:RUS22266.1 hypothetical protein BC937DRAFT_89869 [Endogone sp. FLAS-F59071]
MNLLPHKSWNVYNKKNIEKVRKDEQKAREEEEEKAERVLIAERESRIALLRQRAQQQHQISPGDTATDSKHGHATKEKVMSSVAAVKEGHINFWEEFEKDAKAVNKFATNPELDAEKKAENDKWERQTTMYLDTGIKESKPWYSIADPTTTPKPKSKEDAKKIEKASRLDKYVKSREDPLTTIRSELNGKKERKRQWEGSSHGNHAKEHSRNHLHDRQKDRRKVEDRPSASTAKTVDQLREERLARERAERQRVADLLRAREPITPAEDRGTRGKYNSQFNPDATNEAQERWRGGEKRQAERERYRPY